MTRRYKPAQPDTWSYRGYIEISVALLMGVFIVLGLVLHVTDGLALDNRTSGSVSLNYSNSAGEHQVHGNDRLQGFVVEAAIRTELQVNEKISFAGRVCYSCHGFELDSAYAELRLKDQFNVRAGRISVPFGEFMVRRDVAHYGTSSKPLPYMMGHMIRYRYDDLNLSVIPAPYVDNGLMFYGSFWPSDKAQIWYGLYAVSGFQGSNDFDFIAQRDIYFVDNNNTPTGGGQVNFTLYDPGDRIFSISAGGSGIYGKYDADNELAFVGYAAHLGFRFINANLQLEYAGRRTDLDTSLPGYKFTIVDDYFVKDGAYLEFDHRLKPLHPGLKLVYRADMLRRLGQPLPGSQLNDSDIQLLRYTQGIVYEFQDWMSVKSSYELWHASDTDRLHHLLHGGVVLTF